jgi:hypothetical protein
MISMGMLFPIWATIYSQAKCLEAWMQNRIIYTYWNLMFYHDGLSLFDLFPLRINSEMIDLIDSREDSFDGRSALSQGRYLYRTQTE